MVKRFESFVIIEVGFNGAYIEKDEIVNDKLVHKKRMVWKFIFVPIILGLDESEFGAVERKNWHKWIE